MGEDENSRLNLYIVIVKAVPQVPSEGSRTLPESIGRVSVGNTVTTNRGLVVPIFPKLGRMTPICLIHVPLILISEVAELTY